MSHARGLYQCRRIYQCGRFYHRLGANVLAMALLRKKPLYRWKSWQARPQTTLDVAAQPWRWAGGVGVISGIGGWRAFDFDHCLTFDAVAQLLAALGLPHAYPWVVHSGSGRGWHVWVRCPEPLTVGALPAKRRNAGVYTAPGRGFDHLELRWQHCYTVAPPSLHVSGGRYRFVHGRPTTAPALVTPDRVVAAFHAVTLPREASRATQGMAVRLQGMPTRHGDPFVALKAQFDMLTFAQDHWPGRLEDEGDDVRILGYGGLLLNSARGVWFCFLDQMGGDVIDLVGYARYGTDWDRHQRGMFRAAVQEAAALAGVPLTVPENSGGRQIHVVIGMHDGQREGQGVPPVSSRETTATVPENSTGRHTQNRRRSRPSTFPASVPPSTAASTTERKLTRAEDKRDASPARGCSAPR